MCKRMLGIALAIIMLSNTSGLAMETPQSSATTKRGELMCYSDGEGRTLTNIDGEVYQVIDVDDLNSQTVTDPHLLAQLNEGIGSYALSEPAYDYDLTRGSYAANVNLDNGTWTSPVFKRGYYECTGIHLPSGRYWINYFYYNSINEAWRSIGYLDVKFDLIVREKAFWHGSAGGEIINRCMVQLVDSSFSPRKFNVTIDLNSKYGASLGGLLT